MTTVLRQKLGLLCHHCGEPFERLEYGLVTYCLHTDGWASIARHYECQQRRMVGSVGHILGFCGYEDPPKLTTRQAARLAAAAWQIVSR